jgi:hypothetical protein
MALTEEQAEEYAIALLKDRGVFETLMLLVGVIHEQAEANQDNELMSDSDKLFEWAHELKTVDRYIGNTIDVTILKEGSST